MYPVWKRKQLKLTKWDYEKRDGVKVITPRYVLRCELRESYRDGDKTSSKTKAYFGSIHETEIESPCFRQGFWNNVDYKLRRLKLSPQMEESIRAKINERVPRPSKRDVVERIRDLMDKL